jgi:hypothetical protein
MDVFESEKKRTLKLADGNEYELPIMNLTTLANVESTLGFGLNKLQAKVEESPAVTLRNTIYALLKEKNTELTLDKVGELITLEVMGEVSDVLSKIMAF